MKNTNPIKQSRFNPVMDEEDAASAENKALKERIANLLLRNASLQKELEKTKVARN
jgi:hypothetical protein